MNWGGLTEHAALAEEVRKQKKHCILLWMNGGASQFETFDMKPGRPTGGPFRPIATNVPGMQVCELMPKMAKQMDKVAVIRSMRTSEVDHPGGIYLMHTGYRPSATVRFPGDRRHRRQVPGSRRGRPAQLHQGVRRTATPGPASSARSISRSASAPRAACRRSRCRGMEPARERAAARTASFVEDQLRRPTNKGEVAKHAPRGLRGRPPAAEAAATSSRSTPSGRSTATCTATASSASAACWPGGWSRPAWPSSRSARAATTRTPTTSAGTAAWCRRWNTPGPGCSTDLKQRGLLDKTLVVWTGEIGRTPQHQQPGRPRPPRPLLVHRPGRVRHQGRPGLRRLRRGRRRCEGQPGHRGRLLRHDLQGACRSTRRPRTTPACARCRSPRSARRW